MNKCSRSSSASEHEEKGGNTGAATAETSGRKEATWKSPEKRERGRDPVGKRAGSSPRLRVCRRTVANRSR